ncbi:universal stress protein [Nocardia uniformis]|uniref:Universal stress protein n=1 Tax=Nocardia uniformis TaxID=53432 RepID=A0A849C8P2_9NOCA|nr:universal stress protein [Nocardia uniformis]NNH69331.1 universal stress protein [Nocardia uniformis]
MTDRINSEGGQVNPQIVVAVDGSAAAYAATAWAAVDADLRRCPLHIVTSLGIPTDYGPGATLTDPDVEWLRTDGERVLTEATRVARTVVSAPAITSEVIFGPIIADLIDRSRQATMLVVGSRGLGTFQRGLLGSVSTAMSRHAHCPVAVVHSTSATDAFSIGKPVLVGVDGTPNSMPAIELAFEEASRRKVSVVALHAWSDVGGPDLLLDGWDAVREHEETRLAESLADVAARYPEVSVRRVLVRDRPVRSLLDESENAQLVVVGSHGRGGFTGMLLGSTSAALLHSVDCPIIVVRTR